MRLRPSLDSPRRVVRQTYQEPSTLRKHHSHSSFCFLYKYSVVCFNDALFNNKEMLYCSDQVVVNIYTELTTRIFHNIPPTVDPLFLSSFRCTHLELNSKIHNSNIVMHLLFIYYNPFFCWLFPTI